MHFLQAGPNISSGSNYIMLLGTLGMVSLTLGIVFFVIFHQRKVTRFNMELKKIERQAADPAERFYQVPGGRAEPDCG